VHESFAGSLLPPQRSERVQGVVVAFRVDIRRVAVPVHHIMSHRAPFNSRSTNASPAPVLLPGGQYGASSGRSSSPYGNLAARSGVRGVNAHAGSSDTHGPQASSSHSGGGYSANARNPVPRFTESPYQADSYSKTAQQLEHQNDDKLEGLMSKVRILKDVSWLQLVFGT
jgi:hypothetical protein